MTSNLFHVILNSTNVVPGDNSTYIYTFPRGAVNFKKASVGINQINMYNSVRNVTNEFNNRAFKLLFPTGAIFTEYDVILPEGSYNIEQINAYMQKVMVDNHLYHINATTGAFRYYIELKASPTTYGISLVCYTLPTSLPSGFNEPTGSTFPYPSMAGQEPSLILLNNNFNLLIGFSRPAGGTAAYFDHTSDFTPDMSAGISSILVRCNLINNVFSNPNDVIYSLVSHGVEYGGLISSVAPNIIFSRIPDGYYESVVIKFVDNQFRRLDILDTNLVIYLIIKIDE